MATALYRTCSDWFRRFKKVIVDRSTSIHTKMSANVLMSGLFRKGRNSFVVVSTNCQSDVKKNSNTFAMNRNTGGSHFLAQVDSQEPARSVWPCVVLVKHNSSPLGHSNPTKHAAKPISKQAFDQEGACNSSLNAPSRLKCVHRFGFFAIQCHRKLTEYNI